MPERGRPSKYSEAYCVEVVECLAEGHSVTAFAGRIGVARSTVFKWADEIAEFSDALKVGQAKAVDHWETILMSVAKEGKGNATAAIFGLKNRASDDWSDKIINEHTGKGGGPIETVDATALEVARRVAFILASGTQTMKDETNG
jgi:transposase-like protein